MLSHHSLNSSPLRHYLYPYNTLFLFYISLITLAASIAEGKALQCFGLHTFVRLSVCLPVCHGTEPFRSRANSLPGRFAPWNFRSPERNGPALSLER